MQSDKPNNWDEAHSEVNEEGRNIFNNHGQSSPVIIHAECRAQYGMSDKLIPYDHISGTKCSQPFRVTIHNYYSEALEHDPTIKSEQNYFRFLHLSTLLATPWGASVKFRDDEGVVFGANDIVRLLEERTEEVMKKWEEGMVEFKKKQDETINTLNNSPRVNNNANTDDNIMVI